VSFVFIQRSPLGLKVSGMSPDLGAGSIGSLTLVVKVGDPVKNVLEFKILRHRAGAVADARRSSCRRSGSTAVNGQSCCTAGSGDRSNIRCTGYRGSGRSDDLSISSWRDS